MAIVCCPNCSHSFTPIAKPRKASAAVSADALLSDDATVRAEYYRQTSAVEDLRFYASKCADGEQVWFDRLIALADELNDSRLSPAGKKTAAYRLIDQYKASLHPQPSAETEARFWEAQRAIDAKILRETKPVERGGLTQKQTFDAHRKTAGCWPPKGIAVGPVKHENAA